MPAIKYQFIADGQATVRDAFKSIGDEARDSSKAIEQGMRAIRTSSRVSSQETLRNQRAETERNKVVESAIDIRRKQAAELAKQVSADQATQSKLAKGEQRELDKRRKEIAKDVDARKKLQERNQEHERRHQDKLTQIKRVQQERSDRDQQKLLQQENRHQQSIVATREKYNAIYQSKKDALKGGDRFGALKATARGAFIGASAATVASTLGIAGSAARQSLALHEVSNRLSISARGAGEEAVDPRELRKEFEQTAAKTPGIAAIDVANAVQQFVTKTGELGVARKSQQVFATVASATGSNVEDVAGAAADLFQKFDINTVEGMADAMAALAFQGKAGAFELKDAASQFASMSAAAARFGLAKGSQGVRVLGGLSQIARSTTRGPEMAATAVNAMFRQFVSSSTQGDFKKLGVQVFKDKGKTQTRDIRDLLVETIGKAGGDQTKLSKIFGDEGMGAVSAMVTEFNRAQQEASTKGLTGKDANAFASTSLRGFIDKSIDAPGDYKELQRDAVQAQQDSGAKLTGAWEKIVGELSDGAIPALTSLVATLENSPGAIDALIGTIENLIWFFAALVEASQAVLEFFNIVSKKTISPEQRQADARKRAEIAKTNLELFDKKHGGSWEQRDALLSEAKDLKASGKTKEAAAKQKEADVMTDKLQSMSNFDADARATLAGKLGVAKNEVGQANAEVGRISDQKTRIRSSDTFAKEYEAMLDQSDPEKKGQHAGLARAVAIEMNDQRLVKDMSESDKLYGETDTARDFRVNQATARKDSMGIQMNGQETTSDNSTAAMAKVEAAAKALEQAAAKLGGLGQASIVPQP